MESEFGQCIRDHRPVSEWTASELVSWLSQQQSIVVSLRVSQDWLATSWGHDGLVFIPEQVEEILGDRLRLEQYRVRLLTAEGADELSTQLAESQRNVL